MPTSSARTSRSRASDGVREAREHVDHHRVERKLLSTILYRLLLSGPPLDRRLTTSLADAVLDSFSPDGRATRIEQAPQAKVRRLGTYMYEMNSSSDPSGSRK